MKAKVKQNGYQIIPGVIKNAVIYFFMYTVALVIAGCSLAHEAFDNNEAIMRYIEAKLPWQICAIVIFLTVLVTAFVMFDRSRQKLQRENERIRIMLDTIPIACFIWNRNNTIIDCNNEAVRLFELNDKQEFIEHFKKDLSPEYQPDGQLSSEAIVKLENAAHREGKCTFNWVHQLADGTPVPASVTLERVMYGKNEAYMTYIRDMREHKKMIEEIDRQNRLLKAVNNVSSTLLEPDIGSFEDALKKSMDIIAEVTGVNRICIWRNSSHDHRQRFSLVYQWEADSFKTQAKDGVLAPDLWFEEHPSWNEPMTKGECLNSFVRNMPSSEQAELTPRNILSLLVVPVFFHDHFWGFVGFDHCKIEKVFTDIEVMIMRSASRMLVNAVIRNETADELVYAKEQAEQSNRSKTIFLSQMSHEIRTPMNAILGIAEIQLENESLLPDTAEAFGRIYESGDLLLNIINDILDLSRIEAGRLKLTLQEYDVPSLINDTAQLNIMRYDSKQIDFIVQVDENTPVNLFGDELRIKQILNNILSNAFKYTDAGKIEFNVSVEPDRNNQSDVITLVFRVSDTGQGMTENQIGRLFEEYTRFNLETNRTIVGVGLGMNITKRLVNLMNGSITVWSEPGKGSVFTVRLPQKRLKEAVCGSELAERLRNFRFQNTGIKKKAQFIREYMPYGSVLVVDDVESNLFVVRGLLQPYGLRIDTAISGFDAIKKIEDGNIYDIVFMDHMMPKMDGIQATKKIRDMGYTHSIVALTANALVGRAEMFLKNGFDRYIPKPIDSRELNFMLNELIRNKQPPEVIQAARQEAIKQAKNGSASETQPARAQNVFANNDLATAAIHDIDNAIAVLDELMRGIDSDSAAACGVYSEDGQKLYTTTVHGMKSVLTNIGEMQLANTALKLESVAEHGETAALAKETPDFLKTLRALVDRIKNREADGGGENVLENSRGASANNSPASHDDMIFLQSKLDEIKAASEKLQVREVKAALAGLKQKTWPQEINDSIGEISLYLLRGEYARVVSAVDKAYAFLRNP